MKSCRLKAINKLEYEDVELLEPKADEVRLKIKACGICSSDLNRVFRTGTYAYPTALGHEFSGEIVALGKNVPSKFLKKSAVVFPLLPCFKCDSCKKKSYALCKNYDYFGSRRNGAFSEYLNVPLWNIKTFSDKKISYPVAALCEPAAVAAHAVKQCGNVKGKNVCIIGSGTIGILCGLMLSKMAKRVVFISRNAKKTKFLSDLGFKYIVNSGDSESVSKICEDESIDISLECVGSASAVEAAISIVAQAGKVILVGNPESDISIARNVYWKILRSELSIHGVWNSSYKNAPKDDWDYALKFLQDNAKKAEILITHSFGFKDIKKAFKLLDDKKIFSIKGMIINE